MVTTTIATTVSRSASRLGGIRITAWVALIALAALLASERVYWYWGGIDVEQLSVLTLFYAAASGVALFGVAATRGTDWRQLVLAGGLFALVVEGVVTPVIYEDGPLPLLFLMFVGWHGLLAFVGFAFLVRRWLLDDRLGRLLLASVATGAGWGLWALASSVTDRETAEEIAAEGAGSAEVLDPSAFGIYALWVGVALVAAHLLLGWVWPGRGWRPGRAATIVLGGWCVFLTATLVVPVVPWAPLKLAAIGWVLWRLLRGAPAAPVEARSDETILDRFAGRVPAARVWPLVALPATATAVYATLWPLRDAGWMSDVFWGLIAVQVAAGAVAMVWAGWPRRAALNPRRPTPGPATPPAPSSSPGR